MKILIPIIKESGFSFSAKKILLYQFETVYTCKKCIVMCIPISSKYFTNCWN